MSNANDNNKSLSIKFELPQVVNVALQPLASAIGNTLSTAWKGLTIGIDTWYDKKVIERNVYLEKFKNSIQNELSVIPEENLQEPKMSIIGPSLDASKYYFEEEQYREMFSKLIANACNSQKNNYIHACFVEIIKQMDPKDAILFQYVSKKSDLGIVEFRYISKNNNYESYLRNSFLTNPDTETLSENAASITNLERLGLVEIDYSSTLTDAKDYAFYENHREYKEIKAKTKKHHLMTNSKIIDFSYQKGVVSLTPLGKDFVKVCIE